MLTFHLVPQHTIAHSQALSQRDCRSSLCFLDFLPAVLSMTEASTGNTHQRLVALDALCQFFQQTEDKRSTTRSRIRAATHQVKLDLAHSSVYRP
jgi:hypothetical protein